MEAGNKYFHEVVHLLYLVVNEIINAVAETEEEKKIIHERLMAKYLVAGFVTVTTFSVIVAGIFVKFI